MVDMYRGIIQHRTYITDYLEQQIRERGLEQPVGLGRIYRIVYDSAGVGSAPHMRAMSAEQLVHTLTHASGWWRITAQRLLVEHGDTSIAPALRALQRHDDDRVRLHALWTLDGLGCLDAPTVMAALADASPHVRAAAIRVAEPWIARNEPRIRQAVSALARDSAVSVRRQLAASLTALARSRTRSAGKPPADNQHQRRGDCGFRCAQRCVSTREPDDAAGSTGPREPA